MSLVGVHDISHEGGGGGAPAETVRVGDPGLAAAIAHTRQLVARAKAAREARAAEAAAGGGGGVTVVRVGEGARARAAADAESVRRLPSTDGTPTAPPGVGLEVRRVSSRGGTRQGAVPDSLGASFASGSTEAGGGGGGEDDDGGIPDDGVGGDDELESTQSMLASLRRSRLVHAAEVAAASTTSSEAPAAWLPPPPAVGALAGLPARYGTAAPAAFGAPAGEKRVSLQLLRATMAANPHVAAPL